MSRTGPARPVSRRWPLRDYPVVCWLALALLLTLVHPFVPGSRWLMVHLVLLGALTHAAVVWGTHFSQALLKTPPDLDGRRLQSQRVGLLIVGTAIALVGVPTRWWPVTVTGATLVAAAVVWHAVQLWRRLRRALPGRLRITVRYYLAAAACLPVGATFGVLLARGQDDDWHGRLLVAHTVTMLLGWIGLTVTGTLVTLWPTMLRTRLDDRAERWAAQALPGLAGALAVAVTGALLGTRVLAAAGLAGYLAAYGWWGRSLVRPARTRPPRRFATWSVSVALTWYVGCVAWVGAEVLRSANWWDVADGYGFPVTAFVVGFGLQLLFGALSWLIPSVFGGGAGAVRAGQAWFDRWAVARLVLVNAGLLLCLLPIPSVLRVVVSTLVLVALAAFLPVLFGAIRAVLTTQRERAEHPGPRTRPAPEQATAWSSGQLVGALGALAVAVTLGVGIDPASAGLAAGGTSAARAVAATGQTTRVRVEARDMRFTPASVTVPVGHRLVVELVNTDPTTSHDLVLATGAKTARLAPGASTELDAGVIGGPVEGWCSVVGHRQMGMTFAVQVGDGGGSSAQSPAPAQVSAADHGGHGTGTSPSPGATGGPIDLHRRPGPEFTAVDPALPPLGPRTHRLTLTVLEVELEVAPGVWQRRWTYNGRTPGPTLHGRVGDVFDITLVNDGSMGHSIDFHAGALAPDRPMRTIAPGQRLTYRFTATRSGIWMYHCSTMPMSAHIAAGMHGAVVIEPPGMPAVDRSYLLVQSEVYLGGNREQSTAGSAAEVDADAVNAERPSAVVFNGIAGQYDHRPLTARVGERVRIWVLDAGPNRPTSFHIVGGQFDTVYAEGTWLLRRGASGDGGGERAGADGANGAGGSQALALATAQGGFVELSFPEPGHYPLVSHIMVDAERGAHGIMQVAP